MIKLLDKNEKPRNLAVTKSQGSIKNGKGCTNPELKEASNKPQDSPDKPFDRQSTITRLAVFNTATEILKTHRKPIEFGDIVSLAAQLEKWALGK